MIFGTSSGAGKSLMTAALCRVLLRRGENPVPFKGQNMSNNAWVDKNGGEMAFSQAMQAWAAGSNPECYMNPILLKPKGDSTSEVIHLGKCMGTARADKYYEDWFDSGWAVIVEALNDLIKANHLPRIVAEGAGSPVEVNLQSRDLTNLRIAKFIKARCLLIADIERGGVFAQIVGTLALLSPEERKLIRGILINKFRGRRELFDDGKKWIEKETGIPVVGVMPWLATAFPPEDSLDLIQTRNPKNNAQIEIVVIKLPSISNFSDLDPLENENTVNLRWVEQGQIIGNPDALIIPGSKQTISDLNTLYTSGLSSQIKDYAFKGGHILGICGGMQMLGRFLKDSSYFESNSVDNHIINYPGLNLLPIQTEFKDIKSLGRKSALSKWPSSVNTSGFELHRGVSNILEDGLDIIEDMYEEENLGWVLKSEKNKSIIAGTYLHGIFDNGVWRRLWLNKLREVKNLEPLSTNKANHSEQIDNLMNIIADEFERYVDLSPLLEN